MNVTEIKNNDTAGSTSGQYVIFEIGEEMYGIDVMNVQEVIGITDIHHVPDTQHYMKGVIDLRGTIVPVVDLRIKIDLPEIEYTEQTVIIIVQVHSELVGLVVDAVVDVIEIVLSDIQDTPHFSVKMDNDCIVGIGKIKERITVIVDAGKVLTIDEMKGIMEKI